MQLLIVVANTDVETVDTVEELILGQAQLQTIDDGYQTLGLDTPEWVIDKIDAVGREITGRVQGELKRKLRNALSRREALKTTTEKRKDLDAEIKDLQSKLA